MRLVWLLFLAVTLTTGCKKEAQNVVLPQIGVDEQAKIEAQLKKEADERIALPPEPDERGVNQAATEEPVN